MTPLARMIRWLAIWALIRVLVFGALNLANVISPSEAACCAVFCTLLDVSSTVERYLNERAAMRHLRASRET